MEEIPASVLVPNLCMGHSWPVGHHNLLYWVLQPTSHQSGALRCVLCGKGIPKGQMQSSSSVHRLRTTSFCIAACWSWPKCPGPHCSAAFGSSAARDHAGLHTGEPLPQPRTHLWEGEHYLTAASSRICVFARVYFHSFASKEKKNMVLSSSDSLTRKWQTWDINTTAPVWISAWETPALSHRYIQLMSAGSSHSPLWPCQLQQGLENLCRLDCWELMDNWGMLGLVGVTVPAFLPTPQKHAAGCWLAPHQLPGYSHWGQRKPSCRKGLDCELRLQMLVSHSAAVAVEPPWAAEQGGGSLRDLARVCVGSFLSACLSARSQSWVWSKLQAGLK